MNATVQKNKLRTALWRMLAGALAGATGTALFLALADNYMDFGNPETMFAVSVGLIYALIGVSVGLGIIAPRTGARFLNVEDADELREEGPKLRLGAIASILIGAFLLVLALGGEGALISGGTAITIAGACLVAIVILTLASTRRTDEMTRQISLEASSFTLHTALVALGAWAALAHLGYVGWLSPLTLISGLALLELIAIMAVSAAKGLLVR